MFPNQSGQTTDDPPSPEELLALLEMLQQQGMSKDQIPPDLQTLLDNVKRQKTAKPGAAAAPDAPTEEITPSPGFVIKTTEVASGRKVFINVCSSDRVAAPGGWAGGVMPDEVAAALEKMQTANGNGTDSAAAMTPGEVEALRFPLSCSPPRPDSDHNGAPCTVVDVVFNADVVRAAAVERRLKALLIEVSTGWVATKLGQELDPRYKLPRMRYKGEVVASQRIRADDKRKQLVTELGDLDEEPSFPLRPTKPPPTQPTQQQQAAVKPASMAAPAGPSGPAAAPTSKTAAGAAGAAKQGQGAPSEPCKAGGGGGAAPAAGASAGGGPPYKVEYEGRPVEWVRVTLDVPPSSSMSSAGQLGTPADPAVAAEPLTVEVCGRALFVRFPGQAELQVPLLFAVSAEGATAALQPAAAAAAAAPGRSHLVVRLPYRSLDEHLVDARAQAPLSFGQLGFASSELLELEP